MAYYLGIDGGGSKTTCAVGDERSQLATAVAGPSNITRVGESQARESLHRAIRQACVAAKIEPRQIDRTCIGAAGTGRPEVAATVRKIIAELIPSEIEVVGDMTVAMEAAFGTAPGVIVIAGTGSIAYGRNAQGVTTRAGGWGFAVSDEGSAHWIGQTAVTAMLRAIDEETDPGKNAQAAAESIPLFRELKAAWNVGSLDQLVRAANAIPDFAALLPAIIAVADTGDALSQHVLAEAGSELARLAGIVIGRLSGEQSAFAASEVRLAIAGGVFRHSTRVREYFCREVRKAHRDVDLNENVIEPVVGALNMARRRATVKEKNQHST